MAACLPPTTLHYHPSFFNTPLILTTLTFGRFSTNCFLSLSLIPRTSSSSLPLSNQNSCYGRCRATTPGPPSPPEPGKDEIPSSEMALSRLALKNLQSTQLLYKTPLLAAWTPTSKFQNLKWNSDFSKRLLSSKATDDKSDGREIAVSEGDKKSSKSLFPIRRGGLWSNNNNISLVPSLSGLGNALMQATHNINKLFENLTPSRLIGRVKEKDDCYKLRFEVPGVAKEDVKIRVEDGVLSIIAEQKQEEEDESDDEYWSASSYGYYNTSLLLPEDAKVDEIKAEMKDGVLYITIPRDENMKKNVKEVQVL